MIRHRRTALPAVFALSAALAGGGTAASAPAPPPGFHATGTLVVAATVGGTALDVGGTVAVYERASVYRLDLLTLAFPGTDPTAGAIAGALLAPGGATLIYDGASGTLTAYSTGNRVYYQAVPKAAAAAVRGAPAGAPVSGAADPLATLATVARQLRDVEQAAIQLTGHSTVNGHPTTDLDITAQRRRPGQALEQYHAQISLADDLDGFPVRIALSSTPPAPQDLGGSLRLDLTGVTRATPDSAIFAIPAGLTRVDSLSEVLQAKH